MSLLSELLLFITRCALFADDYCSVITAICQALEGYCHLKTNICFLGHCLLEGSMALFITAVFGIDYSYSGCSLEGFSVAGDEGAVRTCQCRCTEA